MERVLTSTGDIIPVANPIWQELSCLLEDKIEAVTLHAYLHSNTHELRSRLHLLKFKVPYVRKVSRDAEESRADGDSGSSTQEQQPSCQSLSSQNLHFTMTLESIRALTDIERVKNGNRFSHYRKFKKYEYQTPLSKKCWVAGCKCAIMFENIYINNEMTEGRFTGKLL